jgi:hypothetical protein
MATPSPDPQRPSWLDLARQAARESPPEIDVRRFLATALRHESQSVTMSGWIDELIALGSIRWMRAGLTGGFALALLFSSVTWYVLARDLPEEWLLAAFTSGTSGFGEL